MISIGNLLLELRAATRLEPQTKLIERTDSVLESILQSLALLHHCETYRFTFGIQVSMPRHHCLGTKKGCINTTFNAIILDHCHSFHKLPKSDQQKNGASLLIKLECIEAVIISCTKIITVSSVCYQCTVRR